MKVGKILLGLILFVLTATSSMFAKNIAGPAGITRTAYDASYALYATSADRHFTEPHFLCTVTAFEKYEDGYLFIGAGHCTVANPELPADMAYFVETDINQTPLPIQLIKAEMVETFTTATDHPFPIDYAIFYLKTTLKIPTIPLGTEEALAIGSPTVNVNFSEGETKYVSPGIVSSLVSQTGTMKGFYGVQMFASHGASGSSIIDPRTKTIVGILIAGNDGETLPNWILPVSAIEAKLDGEKFHDLIVAPEIPKVDRSQVDEYDYGVLFAFSWHGSNGGSHGSISHGSGSHFTPPISHVQPPINHTQSPINHVQHPAQHPGHADHEQHHEAGQPLDHQSFGKEHCFRPETQHNGGFYSFVYAGIWFEYIDEWPYPGDDVFIDQDVDGFYYMASPVHPGLIVRIWLQ